MTRATNIGSTGSSARRSTVINSGAGPLTPWGLILLSACFAVLGPSPATSASATTVEFEASLANTVVSGGGLVVQSMSGFGSGWGGDAQLFWRPPGPDNQLAAELVSPVAGSYELTLYYTVAPDFGDFSVQVGDADVAKLRGYAPAVGLRSAPLGQHELDGSSVLLVATVYGKAAESTGYILGLDRLELVPVDGNGVAMTTPGLAGTGTQATGLPTATRIAIPGLKAALGSKARAPREEFVAIEGDRIRLGWVTDEGEIAIGTEYSIPAGLHWAANFDGQVGDELLTYDPATGEHRLTHFSTAGAPESESVLQAKAFDPSVFRAVGRFVDPNTSCLLGWKESEAFGLRQMVEGVCFSADALYPVQGVALAADVTGDGRDEAVFVTPEGTVDVVLLSGRRLVDTTGAIEPLEYSVQRAADKWSQGLEVSFGDLDGDRAAELLAVVRPAGEVWRMTFDSAGRMADRRLAAAGWPGNWALLQRYDANGDGKDELLVKDQATGDFRQARWNPGTGRLDTVELAGVSTSYIYPGNFLADGRDSLLLQRLSPGKGGKLGVVGTRPDGSVDRRIDDDRILIPELATIVVGDFIPDN